MSKENTDPQDLFGLRISTATRMLLLGGVLFAGFAIVVMFSIQTFGDKLLREKHQGLQQLITLAQKAIDPVLQERRNGKITMAQARIKVTEAVNRFVYNDSGGINFLFLTTYDGYLLVDPSSPDEVGTYQMQRKDKAGALITQNFLKKALSNGGFVDTFEARTPGGPPQKKISFVVGIPEIECYLGTGIFVQDLEESIHQLRMGLLLLGFILVSIIFALQFIFLRPLFRCVEALTASFRRIGENPNALHSFDLNLQPGSSDAKEMMVHFSAMMDHLKTQREQIEQNVEKYKRIAHAATDVIWQWDRQSATTHWSHNIRDMLGMTPDGINAHFEADEAWIHIADREKRRQALAAYFAGETKSYVCDYRVCLSEPFCLHVQARGVAEFDGNNLPIRMFGSLIDISEIIQAPTPQMNDDLFNNLTSQTMGDILQKTPSVSGDMSGIDVKNRLDKEKWPGIVIVEGEKPVGLVMKHALNQHMSGQYGVSLYYNRPVRSIMDASPLIAEHSASLDEVAALTHKRPEEKLYDLIIVTVSGKYTGTVSVMDLLQHLTDLRIQLAANANPLTGLAGNRVIDEKIRLSVKQNKPFAALYLDLDNFKAFNDKYGFERGDAAIRLLADILKKIAAPFGQQDAFLGHIGGDDFILLLSEQTPYVDIAKQILKSFDEKIRDLYSPEDLAQNCISVINRKGELDKYPIMSLSIAIIDAVSRHFSNYLEVAEAAAALKKCAKAKAGSTWVMDRRKQCDD